MLQSIAVWVLQTYAGEYIENLNADQLTIGYDGIELENLLLKPSAFKKLRLPIKLISGSIGKLNLVIPYANPSTEPWIIKIEDLSLVVESDTTVQYDHEVEEEFAKQKKLDKLEAEWKANKVDGAGKGSWWSRSWFPSIYSSISTRIADNLQTDIRNVKIQFRNQGLSLTVFIESLSAHTSNDQWVKTTEGSGNQMKYKLLLLQGLSLYSNDVNEETLEDPKYILGPVFAECRIIRNASKVSLSSKDGPRFYIEMLLENVKLSLTDRQYQVVADLMEDLNLYFKSIAHSSSKPSVSVRKNPKAWWQFAIKSVLEPIKESNRHWTKDFLVKRVLDINLYVVLYAKHLQDEVLGPKEKESLKSIEGKMKYEEIAILRKVIFARQTEQLNVNQVVSAVSETPSNVSWTGWIMSFNPLGHQQAQLPMMNEDTTLTKEEEKFLDELTEFTVEGDTLFNRDSIFAKIAFTLNNGSVVLFNEKTCKELLGISFKGVSVTSNVYSKSRSWEWTMTLQTFLIASPNSENRLFPHLMSPQNQIRKDSSSNEEPFLSIKFGQKQLYRNSAFNVAVNMQPSNVVYNFSVVAEVKAFFTLPEKSKYTLNLSTTESMTHRFQAAVNTQFQELKLATKAEFDNIVAGTGNHFAEEGNEWTVYLDIAAPSIILPGQVNNEDAVSDDLSKKMVILNLGRLTFYNDHAKRGKAIVSSDNDEDETSTDEFVTPSSTPPSAEEPIPTVDYIDPKLDISEIMEKFYDSYTLELSMVQVLVSDISKDWFLYQPKGFGPDHIIEEFSVNFSLKRRTIFTTDPALPALTLSTVLPQLCVHIDQTKMNVLYRNVNMIKATLASKNGSQTDLTQSIINRENAQDKVTSTEIFEVSYADLLAESKLVLAKFNIEKLSLGLHSRGRCFAELLIEAVECEYVKRPQDTSVSFSLSSLLLIDAMQTFGSDYELLISSKCLNEVDNDVLIHICYQIINADCPSLGNSETTPFQILSVNFNTLHVNGNLETIVELHNVINQVLNQQKKSPSYHVIKDSPVEVINEDDTDGSQMEISAYFKQIDVLLFYTKKEHDSQVPQKVAKVSAGDLQLNSTMGHTNSSSGGIGSITIIDLSSHSLPHKQIFSVGCQGYNINPTNVDMEERKAFTFAHSVIIQDSGDKTTVLNVEMASAYYTHNPYFINQVALCVGDFKQYAYNLAKSLQTTASDLAKSMVSTKRQVHENILSHDHTTNFFIDDILSNDKHDDSKVLFTISVETPVIYLPKDLSDMELIVCNLGKITASNSFTSENDFSSENPDIDKLIIEIQRINLSVVKLTSANVEDVTCRSKPLQSVLSQKDSNHILIIHNTDLFIQADKVSSVNKSTNIVKSSFKLDGKVNTALKLFLSVPTYQQILSTVQFACDIKGELWTPSVPTITYDVENSSTDVAEEDDDPDLTFTFQMPSLQLELHGELQGKPHGFVNIECEMFHLRYVHLARHITLSLEDFFIEDLLCKSNDKFRYLIRSGEKKETNNYLYRASSSCPEYTGTRNVVLLSKSLPNISGGYTHSSLPSSASDLRLTDSKAHSGPLLCLQALFHHKGSNLAEKVNKRFQIDLNCVDVVINLQTWVILFEFFGIGVQNPTGSPVKLNQSTVQAENSPDVAVNEDQLTEYKIDIRSVNFYLNKEEYPLAKAVVDSLDFDASLTNDNQEISGSIHSIELHDLSPFNGFFMKRLITLGDSSAIKVSFYRYGKPDPDLAREFDMSLTLTMSSVQYIHTQRFLTECISFCQHFVFLQEVLGRMRAASAGDEVLAYVTRSPRVVLKINTDAPILILPRKSNSRDVLVANLGKLDVQNKFLYASDPSTEAFNFIASRSRPNGSQEVPPDAANMSDRLLDCIQIQLSDMQIYMAAKVEENSYHYLDMFVKQGNEMMCEPCTLELIVERNIEWAFGRQVPDMSISGRLSSVSLYIDLAQYGQIMDMLADNLGEPLDAFTAPSTVLVDPLVMNSPIHQLWTTLRIKLHLSNVSIEASHEFSYGDLKSMEESLGKLARFDLIKSDLIFESFSDGSKSTDLKSTDVLIYDIRNDKKTKILLPSPKEKQRMEYLQFEIHFLDTKEKSHLTFLCNQSRILLQFDFLLDTFRFILRAKENEYKDNQNEASSATLLLNPENPVVSSNSFVAATAPRKMFELKVNVTESELVVVEDISAADTRTVILQTTAVFAFRPDHFSEKPLTCSLQSLEIFSCHLNQPDDSALSIVDPVAFLVELRSGKKSSNQSGSRNHIESKPVLEVQFQVPVYLRLSYHDVQMFMQIVNKAKEQLSKALDGKKDGDDVGGTGGSEKLVRFKNDVGQQKDARDKGVSLKKAISLQKGDDASFLLSADPKPKLKSSSSIGKGSPSETAHAISGVEIKANFISVTLIDDCGNNEVPLIDLSLNNLMLNHYYIPEWKGLTDCSLDFDYYNTRVSAWEPLIEGWRFNMHWFKKQKTNRTEKTAFKIDAPDRLDINLTNAFIDITNKTANLWKSRFYVDAASNEKKRAPFLPFLLRNKIGCKLTFTTTMKSPAKTANKTRRKEIHQEFEVEMNGEVAFSFEGRSKQRHQGSHQLMVHQIVIQIPGKFDIQPITVDRVGRLFRIAYSSDISQVHSEEDIANDVYLIIDISLEGARKVITVKTALSICNSLTVPIEIVGARNDKHYQLAALDVNETYIVPITMLKCNLFCRPIKGNTAYQFSEELSWRDVTTRGERGLLRYCPGEVDHNLVFRFCALVRCLGFPKAFDWEMQELFQPEHIITLTHHILIYNHLPFDLFYNVKGRAMKELVKPGGKAPLQFKDSGSPIEIGFSFESFPHYDTIKIVYEDLKYMVPIRVYDTRDRLLILHAVVACRSGSVQISVYAPYWLINKTGIPLVFRREEETVEIAGQFEEHEEARSLTPLPFSFLTTTDNYNCQVRIGKQYQYCDGKTPLWSKPFSLEKENDHRTLYIRERRDMPEKGYNIGIMMAWGKGVYSQTKIVSFVPRFQIYNQTSKNIYITQKCMINEKNSSSHRGTLCQRGAVTIFHWPSCNLDNLLCVRMEESTLWSGCIKIDCETTFHINMKTNSKHSTYFRAHISFSAGTFRTTFTDANTFPPPFKIINLSDVALFYWQENKSNEPFGTFIKAKEAKDYALDEPLMPAKLTVSVYQESIHTYDLKQNGKHQAKLYYQNAIFIGLTHTFFGNCKCGHIGIENSDQQLVIDVINDKSIVLGKKADHKRSQLWRMNANGNLVHFDSTTKDKFSSHNILVLDVDDSKEGDVYPLVLNQLNSHRKKTQTWYFESNTLRCCVAGYVVHPLRVNNNKILAVLGLKCLHTDEELPYKTCITSHRLRPGSGVLSAYIFSRGPTQVLEITDSQHENSLDNWVMVEPSVASHSSFMCTSLKDSPSTEVVVSLASGIGISVINFQPEEVIFISLRQMNLNVHFNEEQYLTELEIGKIQVDNQLFGCQSPVAIYASPRKAPVTKRYPDLRLEIKLEKDNEFDLFVFKKFCVDMCRLMVKLEDRLFLKIIQAVQDLMAETSNEVISDEPTNIFDSHKIDHCEESNQRKLFFEDITINQGDLTISLIVTGKIDKDLVSLKSALGIPLVSFESAVFGFEKYSQSNMYDTAEHLLFHLIQFYKTTFISQAAVLLGSLDLLGNPMGLIQDFSSGIEGLLKKGNLGGLFVNVAHGFSDSAAKMTGVIADSLWSASMDNKFLESRDSLRVSRGSSSSTHFSAGLQGLGMGVIGGLTSMVTQPIEGAAKKGFSGFFAGLGKGLVGTVAKPVAGVLDLASGTAAAVRNTTETTSPIPQPVRTKRNCYGPGGVLGKYSKIASEGQDILLKFNDGIISEKYVGMESVRTSPDRLKALFTNKGVYFVKSGPPCPENIKLHVDYTRLLDSSYYFEERHHIIEIYFCKRQNIGVRKPIVDTRTTIRCDNERIAFKVCEKINYLKSLHLESLYIISDTLEYG